MRLFRETGNSVTHKGGGGRPTVCTEQTIKSVREIINVAPATSLRTILRRDNILLPYKMQAKHDMLPYDHNHYLKNSCSYKNFIDFCFGERLASIRINFG